MSTRFRPRGFILVILSVSVKPRFWHQSYLFSPWNSTIYIKTAPSCDILDTFPQKKSQSLCLRVAKTPKKRPKMGARRKMRGQLCCFIKHSCYSLVWLTKQSWLANCLKNDLEILNFQIFYTLRRTRALNIL